MSKIKMYKAKDNLFGDYLMIAVKGDQMAVSGYDGKGDLWLTPEGFYSIDSWLYEELNLSHVVDLELIWEE